MIVAAGIACEAAALFPAVPVAVGVAGWAVGGFGIGLAYSPISLIVLGEAPSGQEGAASSSLQLAETLGVALGAGLGGVLVAVLVHLAGGAAGPGRMADVGAPFLDTLAAAVVALGIGSLVGAVAMTWRLRRAAGDASDVGRDPSTEDTIRL